MKTQYPAQGSTDLGDQSLCPLAGASIEVRAKLYIDWPTQELLAPGRFEHETYRGAHTQVPNFHHQAGPRKLCNISRQFILLL